MCRVRSVADACPSGAAPQNLQLVFNIKAFAVKVATKRLPVFPFSGLLKGCKGHKRHRFENGGTNQIRKTGKREVVLL